MSVAWALLLLLPQDLLERERGLQRRLSPGIDLSGVQPRRQTLQIDAGADFA